MSLEYQNLLGVMWAHGTADCFTLVQKFYEHNFNIAIASYARPSLWWIRNPELDLIKANMKTEGFDVVTLRHARSLQAGDVICMAIGSTVGNHLGVFLGGNKFLHQPFRALSRVDLWAGDWANKFVFAGRHPDVKIVDTRTAVDFMSMVPKWKQEQMRAVLKANGQPDWTERAGGTASQ